MTVAPITSPNSAAFTVTFPNKLQELQKELQDLEQELKDVTTDKTTDAKSKTEKLKAVQLEIEQVEAAIQQENIRTAKKNELSQTTTSGSESLRQQQAKAGNVDAFTQLA